MSTEIHPVDQVLPTPRLLALGLQHVLVMYAGAVAVPLIIGRALKLPPEDVAFLISADLFACGLATLVQCIGFPGVGIRLPMAAAPEIGLLGIYGSVLAAGIFGIIAAPFISRLLPLFPPVVTGTIILVIGISLMRVGINWAGGGLPTLTKVVVAISVGFGMIPLAAPNFFRNLPHDLQPLLESGILLCALVAVLLNTFFNGVGSTAEAEADAVTAASSAQHV
jgi:xanthine/uracil permease